ncbi:MAG: neutral/alkaline non-lysosomal ceramidase N-terminal domain-containing protein [Acidobacteriota bacterium]|nr:neutral/alkaline non-lysosomal ceramidase N-terminal domain-containing protein [Acidobacteriota bacterium]
MPQSRGLLFLCLSAALCLTPACIKRYDNDPFETKDLEVIAVSPRPGERGVPVEMPVYLTFGRDLDVNSLTSEALQLKQAGRPVEVTIRTVTDRVVEVMPAAPLEYETGYLFEADTSISSIVGKELVAPVQIDFQTQENPSENQVEEKPSNRIESGEYMAGAALVDITPPVGVPLSGYGGGERRCLFPDTRKNNFHTLFKPSKGVKDPLTARALVLSNGHERVALVSVDLIAAQEEMIQAAWQKARDKGFSIPLEKVLFCASHTHSGPGAFTKLIPWQYLAVDIYQDAVFQGLSDKIAGAMVRAEKNIQPARIGVGRSEVFGATANRRAEVSSKLLTRSDIDPEMLVIRVDHATGGNPIATVWNFAIHGTWFGPENLMYSADIMGEANLQAAEMKLGIPFFINGAEGDIEPIGDLEETGRLLAEGIREAREAAITQRSGVLQSKHRWIDMGPAVLALSLHQHAGPGTAESGFTRCLRDLGLKLGLDFRMPDGWTPRRFRFQSIRLGNLGITSIPGEPIHQLGLNIKEAGKNMGFEHIMVAALANGHGSYFTTREEYLVGGYEGLASFFGKDNGTLIEKHGKTLLEVVKP